MNNEKVQKLNETGEGDGGQTSNCFKNAKSGHKTVGVRDGTGNPIRLVRNEFVRRLTGCFMTNFWL